MLRQIVENFCASNMKFLSVAVMLCVALCHTEAVKLDAHNARPLAAECMEKTGATETDYMDIFQLKPAASDKAKCLRNCLLHELDITQHTGHFNKDGALDSLSFFAHGDSAVMKKIEQLVENCLESNESGDSCQVGGESFQCILDWGHKLDVSLEY